MHIEFIKNHGAYSPGDIAGFDPAVAEILVKEKGVAVFKRWGDDSVPAVVAKELEGQDALSAPQAKPSGRRKR